jgi:hypothetical protein
VHLQENLSSFILAHWPTELELELKHEQNKSDIEHKKFVLHKASRAQSSFMYPLSRLINYAPSKDLAEWYMPLRCVSNVISKSDVSYSLKKSNTSSFITVTLGLSIHVHCPHRGCQHSFVDGRWKI